MEAYNENKFVNKFMSPFKAILCFLCDTSCEVFLFQLALEGGVKIPIGHSFILRVF